MSDHTAIARLRTILCVLYPESADARRIVHDVGIPLERVSFEGKSIQVWFSVLNEIAKHDRLPSLIDVVSQEYPRQAAQLRTLAGQMETGAGRGVALPILDGWSRAAWPKRLTVAIALVVLAGLLYGTTRVFQAEPEARCADPALALARYDDYPIVYNEGSRTLQLDYARFRRVVIAVDHDGNRCAGAELAYLGANNDLPARRTGRTATFSSQEFEAYLRIVEASRTSRQLALRAARDQVVQRYGNVVKAMGNTFSGTPIELVLHDARDPIHSIAVITNPIDGRQFRDPNSNLGLAMILEFARRGPDAAAMENYRRRGNRDVPIRSTTIPLFDDRFGLVGVLCVNIDTSFSGSPERVTSLVRALSTPGAPPQIDEYAPHR